MYLHLNDKNEVMCASEKTSVSVDNTIVIELEDTVSIPEYPLDHTFEGGVFIKTDKAINAELKWDSLEYQRQRTLSYPSLEEQADMAYWDRKNGTTTLDDALDAIKAEFPKP